jgi:hypothetical protein
VDVGIQRIDPAKARLPETYERAKTALSECHNIDECQDWADKAEALASYAKQADDDTLRKMADRIQARAVRRAGELLRQFQNPGARTDKPTVGTLGRSNGAPQTQREAAEQAGMSEHQETQAVRVSKIPTEVFERQVEGEDPPTVTKLASLGTEPRRGFKQATHLLGAVRRFAEFCDTNDPEEVAAGVMSSEAQELRERVQRIDSWLDRFIVNLRG